VKTTQVKDTIGSRLRTMAQGRDTLDVAQFQFIDLDAIKGAYGERWPENQARIMSVSEDFLRRRMDQTDLLIRADSGFILVFGSASGMAAEASAGTLAHGLNEFFLGEIGEEPVPQMRAVSTPVPLASLASVLEASEVIEAPPSPPAAGGLSTIEWRFQPVWDVRRETLSTWYITPYVKGTNNRVPGYQFENITLSAAQTVAIDEAGLWMSEQALMTLVSRGIQLLMGASIHLSTLTNAHTRTRLLATLDRFDPQLTRYRIFKIAGVAPGFPRIYLDEIVGLLRARVPNVAIGAVWNEPDFGGLLKSGAVAVGVKLPETVLGPTAPIGPDVLLAKVSGDAQAAHAAHKRFFVEGMIEHALP
jgi:hypothetical protein